MTYAPIDATSARLSKALLIAFTALLLATPMSVWAFDPLNGDYTRDDPFDVRIVTYNHNRNFIDDPTTDAEFNRILVALDPDVVVMQEFVDTVSEADITNRFDSILPIAGGGNWQAHLGLLGGIRTVIISRHPLLMTRVDTNPASDTRGVTIALVDLPDLDYPLDVYLMGVHLKCCGNPGGSEDQQRQNSADAMANWLGDARGVARPSGENIALPANTPILMLGDFNMVGGPQPEMTLTTGDIQDEGTYGPDVKGDWDNTDVTDLMPTDPFTGDTFTWQGNGQFPPSALDRIFHTDSATTIANSFILNTDTMTGPALAAAGLQAGDTLPQNASDHLPVVVDLRIANSTCANNAECGDSLFCNGAEVCDTNGMCQAGVDPCPGDICNEALDECGTCSVNGECDDGSACTADTCSNGTCISQCPVSVGVFPYGEDFESGFGDWANVLGDDLDWTRLSGSTPSSNTGPDFDHTTGSGFYAYIEASNPNNPSMSANLNGPCIDLTGAISPELTFWYHMFGSNMGSLAVEASSDCTNWSQIFFISGDQGSAWQQAVVSLNGFVDSVVTLRFRGITGNGFRSDIAIDDILITTAQCIDAIDCDNGLFCDGAEQCVGGSCVSGANPCAAGLLCVESTDTCEVVPGDLDLDLDVDLNDHAVFADCLAGPGVLTPPAPCPPAAFGRADFDLDGDVDLTDSATFFGLLAP